MELRFESVGPRVVCLVDVDPSPSSVYAKATKGDACFDVRINNAAWMLEGPDIYKYIHGH